MIPGKIFTNFAKFQGIESVNDFWFPLGLQEHLQTSLCFLKSFCFARIRLDPLSGLEVFCCLVSHLPDHVYPSSGLSFNNMNLVKPVLASDSSLSTFEHLPLYSRSEVCTRLVSLDTDCPFNTMSFLPVSLVSSTYTHKNCPFSRCTKKHSQFGNLLPTVLQ